MWLNDQYGDCVTFQSPLHRGTFSDIAKSGGVRRFCMGFNPLFFGAFLQTGSPLRLQPVSKPVSIPSSSGHFFRQVTFPHGFITKDKSFNPLFIGALLQTALYQPPAGNPCWFQSPLHRGTSSDLRHAGRLPSHTPTVSIPSSSGHFFRPAEKKPALYQPPAFQSPLHRGTSSDTQSCQL